MLICILGTEIKVLLLLLFVSVWTIGGDELGGQYVNPYQQKCVQIPKSKFLDLSWKIYQTTFFSE